VLDTPGFSSYSVTEISHDTLESFYPDFQQAEGSCRFKGCSHTSEPDCVVQALCQENKLDRGRYNRYVEIYKELKEAYDNRYRR
ncbi:MAG: ribosome small subunit-dependent GTPase A, partial [Clostridia bacterium]|nr:ribosome small subunit-dependent GTPase A [Clostridia bacterium]